MTITRRLGSAGSGTISPTGVPSSGGTSAGDIASGISKIGRAYSNYKDGERQKERRAEQDAAAQRAEQRAIEKHEWAREDQEHQRLQYEREASMWKETDEQKEIENRLAVLALDYQIEPDDAMSTYNGLDDLSLIAATINQAHTGGRSVALEASIRGMIAQNPGHAAFINKLINQEERFSDLKRVVSNPFLEDLQDMEAEGDNRRAAEKMMYDASVSWGLREEDLPGGYVQMVEIGSQLMEAQSILEQSRVKAGIASDNASAALSNERRRTEVTNRTMQAYSTKRLSAEMSGTMAGVYATIQKAQVDGSDPTDMLVSQRQRLEASREEVRSQPEFALMSGDAQNQAMAQWDRAINEIDGYITGDRSLLATRNQTSETLAAQYNVEIEEAMRTTNLMKEALGLSDQEFNNLVTGRDPELANFYGTDITDALREEGLKGASKVLDELGITDRNLTSVDTGWLSAVRGNLPEATKELRRINVVKTSNDPRKNPTGSPVKYVNSVRTSANLISNNFTPNRLKVSQAEMIVDTVLADFETLDQVTGFDQEVSLAKMELSGAAASVINGLQNSGSLIGDDYWTAVVTDGRYEIVPTEKNLNDSDALAEGMVRNPSSVAPTMSRRTMSNSMTYMTEQRLMEPPAALTSAVQSANRSLTVIEKAAPFDPRIPEGAENVANFFTLNEPFMKDGQIMTAAQEEAQSKADLEAEVNRLKAELDKRNQESLLESSGGGSGDE